MVFFIDDNLAINRKRIKSLLREMIERDVCLPWVGQISINLLRDEELVGLIAASGARWLFAGLESMEPEIGLLTPFPATPLYDRLEKEARLTRPKHWLDFRPFQTTFLPRHLSPAQARNEVRNAWRKAYRPAAFRRTQDWMRASGKPFGQQLTLFIARLLFGGIYFPQMTR